MKDPVPYLHELDSNPNYEVLTLIPRDFQIGNPDDYQSTFHRIYMDKKRKTLIIKSRKETSHDNYEHISIKSDFNGNKTKPITTIINIINNGYFFRSDKYSSWIINSESILKDFKPLLSENERNNIDKWLPKFQEAYNKAEYVYVPRGSTEFSMFIDEEWYFMGRQGDTPDGFRNQYPAKNPPGRMMILKDITPDFLEKDYDNSLIELLGYGQEYFEKGEGMNPISGSAGHYYFDLKMKKDTLKFKRFGTMHPNLWVYKIPEELGGHPDVVFVVQEYNRMFPNMEFGGMYVIRPKGLAKKDSLTIEK